MSYPYGGGGGYPQQGGGYPQQGYPQQGAGYPQPQPGYPAGPGYPQQGGMPEPYGGAAGGLPYSAQPPQVGFGGVAGGMPQPGYPAGPTATPAYAPPQNPSYHTPAPPPQTSSGYPGGPAAGYQPPQPGYGQPPPQPGYSGPPGPPAGNLYGQSGYQQPGAAPPQQPYQAGGAPPPQQGYPGGAPPPQHGYGGGSALPPQQSAGGYGQAAGARGSPVPPSGAMANMSLGTKAAKIRTEGTVKPAPSFDAERDSEVLRKAMKGFGTDEKAIIDVLSHRSNEQRQQIKLMFKTMYGRDLISDLKSELGGNFEDCVVAMMELPTQYDAKEMKRAIQGLGTDEDTLIEILCSRTNSEIHAIKAAYKTLFKKDLEKDLVGDTSGDFRKLMVALCAAGRQEGIPIDHAKAQRHAQELYQAGEKQLGTNESKFNQILCSQSFEQLQVVFAEYEKLSKKAFEQVIKSELSGNLEIGMLAIVKCVKNRSAYFAEKLYKSMKGAGTDDRTLVRCVVTRSEVDMVQVKAEFQRNYGKTLQSFIQGDCSGDYKRVLMALVGP